MHHGHQIMSTVADGHLAVMERLDGFLQSLKDHLQQSTQTPNQAPNRDQEAEGWSSIAEETKNLKIALDNGLIIKSKLIADSRQTNGWDARSMESAGPSQKTRSISSGSFSFSNGGLIEGPTKELSPDSDDTTPREVLEALVRALGPKADSEIHEEHLEQAEQHLLDLVKHLQELHIRYGGFEKDCLTALKKLEDVYFKQPDLEKSRKLIDDMLHRNSKPGETSVVKILIMMDAGVIAEKATWYFKSGRGYLRQYQINKQSSFLEDAERDAKRAFNCIFDSREIEEDLFNVIVTLLMDICNEQGKPVHADTYRRHLRASGDRNIIYPSDASLSGTSITSSLASSTTEALLDPVKHPSTSTRRSSHELKKKLIHAIDNENAIAIRNLRHHHGVELDSGLWHAVHNDKAEMVYLLLKLDADKEQKNDYGATPLLVAVAKGFLSVVRVLLNSRVAVRAEDDQGWSVVHCAAHTGNVEMMRTLLEPRYGVEKNAGCLLGKSALHYLAEKDDVAVAKVLLDHQADAAIEDKIKRTPLHIAVSYRRFNFVKMLLKHNVQFDRCSLPKASQEINNLLNEAQRLRGSPSPSLEDAAVNGKRRSRIWSRFSFNKPR